MLHLIWGTTLQGRCDYLNFTNEEATGQQVVLPCPRSHRFQKQNQESTQPRLPWGHGLRSRGGSSETRAVPMSWPNRCAIKTERWGGASRRQKSKTWRSPSSPQIHQKYIYMWNCSYRTPTERWQKTLDLPKGKTLPTYLDRTKEKRNNRDKRIGTGRAPLGGNRGGKVSTH